MMSLPLYGSLLAGWMAVSVMALLATGAPQALRVLLAGLLVALCGVAGWVAPTAAQALMGLAPALALCVRVSFVHDGGKNGSGAVAAAFILSGNAALAVAFGRCDLLFAIMGVGLGVRLVLAHGPRGLDRIGWEALRSGLGGLVMAQGGLSVLQAQWGGMADQAGAVLLVCGVLLACGLLADAAPPGLPGRGMDTLAALPVVARAADMWPVVQPVLTFMGLACLAWAALPRTGRQGTPAMAWGAWAVLATGLPGAATGLPLAACLLVLACMRPTAHDVVDEGYLSWPPFLPGMALVLVLMAQMAHAPVVALLAGMSLWPVMARCEPGMAWHDGVHAMGSRGGLLLVLGCVVLAAVIHHGGIGP
ncbi:hypothetical protein [Komagataeibacter sp. FNDCF1]|uniref:hypothetical protein n=1 Tax=Komagataeibacter sp. FNDCF1 TaxID=2878681 RepID=UPI001E2FBB3A|nr:hypothetical protein [Komagataeibacter sp. FNDCF1]MCE2564322.1 hypothetical protein [Komagataeibacter sp. FNDCF1]